MMMLLLCIYVYRSTPTHQGMHMIVQKIAKRCSREATTMARLVRRTMGLVLTRIHTLRVILHDRSESYCSVYTYICEYADV